MKYGFLAIKKRQLFSLQTFTIDPVLFAFITQILILIACFYCLMIE